MNHILTLIEGDDLNGTWECVACPRRIRLQFHSTFEKTVLVPGDETVGHGTVSEGCSVP